MNIYIALLGIFLIMSILELYFSNRKKNEQLGILNDKISFHSIIVIIVASTLILISGFREITVGRDLINYIPRFVELGNSSWSELLNVAQRYSFEYGFAIVCKIMYKINSSPHFFLLITSICVGVGFFRISIYSKLPLFTYFLLYSYGLFGSSLNVIRQFIALSILTFGIKYIVNRKILKFLLVVLIASSIHSTSIVFIALYFLYDIDFTSKIFLKFIVICPFMAVFANKLVSVIVSRTSFAWYLSGMGEGSGGSTLIFLISILISSVMMKNKIVKFDKNINLWIWGLGLAVLFNSLAISFGIWARVMKFFLPFLTLIIPDLVLTLKKQKLLYAMASVIIIGFFIFYFYFVVLGNTAISEGWFSYVLGWGK